MSEHALVKRSPRIKSANLSPSEEPLVCYTLQKIDSNNYRILEIVIQNDQVIECSHDVESIPAIKTATIAQLISTGSRLHASHTRNRN